MDDDLEARWATRQELLQTMLRAHGALGHDWRVDLAVGRFWWQAPGTAKPVVVASTRVLCSYALSNKSVLMGWANKSLPSSATVPRIAGIDDGYRDQEGVDAWRHAMRIADATSAHFLYRAPSAQSWVFLGLWDVRTAAANEAPFAAGSPWPHVRAVITELARMVAEAPDEARTLARNYGQTFIEDHLREGTSHAAPLRAVGARLVGLASGDAGVLADELEALRAEVAARERS